MNARRCAAFAAALSLVLFAENAHAGFLDGLGAMGDSGVDIPGSWVPVLTDIRGLNFGPNSSFNVAVPGSTTSRLIGSEDQDGQIAALVTAGQVTLPILAIGGNDFGNPNFRDILATTDEQRARDEVIEPAIANIKTAVDTVLAAGPEGFILFSAPELSTPVWREITGGDPVLVEFLSSAVADINDELRSFAIERQIAFIDIAAAQRDFLSSGSIEVGGVTIDTVNSGRGDKTFFFVDRLHPGDVGNGLIANLVIAALNESYDTDLEFLSDLEILTFAGLEDQYTGETFGSTVDFSPYIVYAPEPSSWLLTILASSGVVLFATLQRRRAAAA